MRIIFGIVPLATGRHVATLPTREGAKLEFALDGKPRAVIEMTEEEARSLVSGLNKTLDRRAEMKAAGG